MRLEYREDLKKSNEAHDSKSQGQAHIVGSGGSSTNFSEARLNRETAHGTQARELTEGNDDSAMLVWRKMPQPSWIHAVCTEYAAAEEGCLRRAADLVQASTRRSSKLDGALSSQDLTMCPSQRRCMDRWNLKCNCVRGDVDVLRGMDKAGLEGSTSFSTGQRV